MNQQLINNINEASKVIGKTWPLYSFVTSNPLAGYEQFTFEKAIQQATHHLGGSALPETYMFKQALKNGEIDEKVLLSLLAENGFESSPEFYLQEMTKVKPSEEKNANHELDRMMCKWLSVFMDEGSAEWEMPNKEKGFFVAWRKLVKYDKESQKLTKLGIPKTAMEALEKALNPYSEKEQLAIFKHHIAALPGWTGYINYRTESNSAWQQKYPISMAEYLAVRLWIAKHNNADLLPSKSLKPETTTSLKLKYVWLKAWEKSWQNELSQTLKDGIKLTENSKSTEKLPDAQMVFCIDTRSELIRRHIENTGNYETFGYAGFFGIAMDYKDPDTGIIRKSCPPIVGSAYTVSEVAQSGKTNELANYQHKNENQKFSDYFFKRMKNMLPSAFGYVEASGLFYGISLTGRTIFPAFTSKTKNQNKQNHEGFCETEIHPTNHDHAHDIPLNEKVGIVKSVFDVLGNTTFAPLVIFSGHASHSANNAFASSLDCGACAASPGRHNARMLAKIANEEAVKSALKTEFGMTIPHHTLFLGAEHNTATDEITLFDSQAPESHYDLIKKLKADLAKVQGSATQERLGITKNSIEKSNEKSNNWAETRPEWGLAKNASFIIAPRSITKEVHLGGRCFLNSYNWDTDKEGETLEGIMQGPMVVGQWINSQYYFSTVNNDQFGGGSKITQNVIGKLGVVQGNGGDLKFGLPLQSVKAADDEMYHQPLRLSVMVQAPKNIVSEIIERNGNIKTLIDNEWLYLMVMDPLQGNEITLHQKKSGLNVRSETGIKEVAKPASLIMN